MKIIAKISDDIEKEIENAEHYIKCALEKKDEYPELAELYFKLSNARIADITLLHAQVVNLINEYKKEKGEPPESMKVLYELLHHKHIEHLAAVKGMIALYKEI